MALISPKITPFLWFDRNAEEAVNFYISIFPNSRITAITHYGAGAPMAAGTVMTVSFELAGVPFTALNGGPVFTFNEAVSFVIHCDSQAEVDRYWDVLTSNGGAPVQCGWLRDRFGLSWQVVPTAFWDLIRNPATADRVMQALMQMVKIDLATLQQAAQGAA